MGEEEAEKSPCAVERGRPEEMKVMRDRNMACLGAWCYPHPWLPKAMCRSLVLPQLRSVLTSMAQVVTKGHTDVWAATWVAILVSKGHANTKAMPS